jgi:hypothetical protein
MPVYIPHPIAEAVSEPGDDLVCGVAMLACVAAVLEEGKIRLRATQDVIARVVYWCGEGSRRDL